MRRLALLLAFLSALSVGLVPVADTAPRIEAATAAGGHAHHGAHDCGAACEDRGAMPHPGHCPACAALPAALPLPAAAPRFGRPAAAAAPRLAAFILPVGTPPPRSVSA